MTRLRVFGLIVFLWLVGLTASHEFHLSLPIPVASQKSNCLACLNHSGYFVHSCGIIDNLVPKKEGAR